MVVNVRVRLWVDDKLVKVGALVCRKLNTCYIAFSTLDKLEL